MIGTFWFLLGFVAGVLWLGSLQASARSGYQPTRTGRQGRPPRGGTAVVMPSSQPSKFERIHGFDPRPSQVRPEPPPCPPLRTFREGDRPIR